MRTILLVILSMMMSLPSSFGQFVATPRWGAEMPNGTSAASLAQNAQVLMPSIFWSPQTIDFGLNRKWWRNPLKEPNLKNNGLTKIIVNNGSVIWAEPIVAGFVSLYREPVHPANANTDQVMGSFGTAPAHRYWVGKQRFVQINNTNYKNVIKTQLDEAGDLHKKLGKKGFQFENVPSMIVYYNHFYANEPLQIHRFHQENFILN